MKRVIKNQKKMKNTMYIVFGTFALALLAITRINPSYADNGLMIDNALDAIVLYGEVEVSADEVVVDESHDEDIPVVDNERDEDSQNISNDEKVLDEVENQELKENLDGEEMDNGENNENEDRDEEGKREESDKAENNEVQNNEESRGVSDESMNNEKDNIYLGEHEGMEGGFIKMDKSEEIIEIMTEKIATLYQGKTFQDILKDMANGRDMGYWDIDYKIEYFLRADSNKNMSGQRLVSSGEPVYVWFDDSDGTGIVYWYSEADKIYLNSSIEMMFGNLAGLKELDLSYFDSINVGAYPAYNNAFYHTDSLKKLTLDGWDFTNFTFQNANSSNFFNYMGDIEYLSMSGCKMPPYSKNFLNYMYNNDLKYLDVTNLDFSNTDDLEYLMYNACGSLETIKGIETWDVSGINNMHGMFQHCNMLETLDLSSFNVSNVTNMKEMFKDMNNLKTIYVSDTFNTSNVTQSQEMFKGVTQIIGGNGTSYDETKIDKTYARIDTLNNPGYFTNILDRLYTITYNLNGGVLSGERTTYTQRDSFSLPVPIRTGYTFLGWTGSNGDVPQLGVNIQSGTVKGDLEYSANWKINQYTITFDTDGGSEINQIKQDYDTDITVPNNPTKTGYTFSGWNKEIPSKMPAENITITGQWEINQYKIIFDTNGGNEINPIEKDYNSSLSGISLPIPTRECNELSGWDAELPETMPAHDITLKAVWNYTCSKSSGGGGAKKTETITKEVAVVTPTDQEHNSADEQKSETQETSNIPSNGEINTLSNEETSNQVISVTQEVSEDGTVEAVVETIKIKNTDIVATVRTEVNSTNSASSSSSSTTHTREESDAYSFAKSNGITTTSSIDDAKMNTELTRIQMAKMLSNFAINVLGQEPDPEKGIVKFDDVTNKMDKQYDNAVTKAYQLGIMGQNVKNNEFRPNDTVTRAEFASALSRLLYDTEEGNYKGTGKYYVPHVAKLYNEGIINKADPKIKEKRGYVMTMLKRTVE